MATNTRVLEADKLMETGKKHATRGFFKRPDWDAAASDYQRALNIYINAGAIDKAREAAKAASEAHAKNEAFYFAALALDQLGNCLRDRGMEADACPYFVDAAKLFAKDNKPQQQSDTLAKASRCVPPDKVEEAVGWLNEAIGTLESAERWHMVKDLYKNLVLILVRANRFLDAIAVERRCITAMSRNGDADRAAKCALEILVLALALGDEIMADREFQDLSANGYGFVHSKEQSVGYDLVQACVNRDAAALAEVVKDQRLTFITGEISRIAKKIKLPAGAAPPKKAVAALAAGAGPESLAPAVAAATDEENTL